VSPQLSVQEAKDKGAEFLDTKEPVGKDKPPPVIESKVDVHVENKDIGLDDSTIELFVGLLEELKNQKTINHIDDGRLSEAIEKISIISKSIIDMELASKQLLLKEIQKLQELIVEMAKPVNYNFKIIRDSKGNMSFVEVTVK
jgi:hypothetical protein